MKIEEIVRELIKTAEDKRAEDVVALDVQELTTIADSFIIMSARNSRQLDALADTIAEKAKAMHLDYVHTEGSSKGGWILLDLNAVVVHIFSEEMRDYYNLEKLWFEAPQIVVDSKD